MRLIFPGCGKVVWRQLQNGNQAAAACTQECLHIDSRQFYVSQLSLPNVQTGRSLEKHSSCMGKTVQMDILIDISLCLLLFLSLALSLSLSLSLDEPQGHSSFGA